MTSVEEFERILKEFPTVKPPGVSGSRIRKLKDLFLSNIQDEEILIRKLYDSCKSTPTANKLGPFYVVDAIIRGLQEELSKYQSSAVEINETSQSGTIPAAIFKIQSLFPSLVDDIVPVSNDDVRHKISNLVEIWAKCQTFSPVVLKSIKLKYFTSTTPPGTPPQKKKSVKFDATGDSSSSFTNPIKSPNSSSSSSSAKKDPSSVLQALANMSKKTSSPGAAAAALSKTLSPPPPPPPSSASQKQSLSDSTLQISGASSADPNAIFQLLQNMNKISGAQPNYQQQEDYNLSKNSSSSNGSMPSRGAPLPSQAQSFHAYGGDGETNVFGGGGRGGRRNYRERDSFGRRGGRESGNGFSRRRDRSPPVRRSSFNDIPSTYVEGERNIPGTPHYRLKKPFIDPTIPEGFIKVYSRTVFIGGVPHYMTEQELTQQLRPYAEVQSVILNGQRKHAFVKVYSRKEAESIISSFSNGPHPSGLRARWGVGFGPRDCCDYQTGVSTIPTSRLTEADQKWFVSAEWGGTGGLPLQSGLFVEEPDIEVGHGVSSKSISKRMPTNSTTNGPKSDGSSNPGNIAISYGTQSPYGGGSSGYQQSPPQSVFSPAQQAPVQPAQQVSAAQVQGLDPTVMMTMMSAMQQMQGQGQGQVGMDMAAMFQNMANLMKQQKHPPQ